MLSWVESCWRTTQVRSIRGQRLTRQGVDAWRRECEVLGVSKDAIVNATVVSNLTLGAQ